jgi:aspartyl protease family protein
MLKSSMLFAGAGLAIVMLAPGLLPMLAQPNQTTSPSAMRAAAPTSEAAPERSASSNNESHFHEMQIPDNGHNQYVLDAYVEGQPVQFIVDTGANMVSLSADTARRLGFADSANLPHYTVSTANGQTAAYGVKLRSIDLGSIYVPDVDALVSPNLGKMNLLGMNFLRRLSKVEQSNGRLILWQ